MKGKYFEYNNGSELLFLFEWRSTSNNLKVKSKSKL